MVTPAPLSRHGHGHLCPVRFPPALQDRRDALVTAPSSPHGFAPPPMCLCFADSPGRTCGRGCESSGTGVPRPRGAVRGVGGAARHWLPDLNASP